MFVRSLLAMVVVLALAAPAMAAHCPLDARAIDNALAKLELDDATRSEAQALRDEGMALHEEGKHADAVNKLSQAMRLLLESL